MLGSFIYFPYFWVFKFKYDNKMKRILVIICLACFSSFFSSKAGTSSQNAPLELKGGLMVGGLVRTPPIEAFLCNTGVYLVFNFDLGNLDIEVINETDDSVFQKKVNALAIGNLLIDTTRWESGEYFLKIMDELGGFLEGCFIIE